MPIIPPQPLNERARQLIVDRLSCFQGIEDEVFNRLMAVATRYFDLPIALVSILDSNRQWFWARVGVQMNETSRDDSFCAYTLMAEEIFEVADATLDERFQDNPMVLGEPGIRFYAACPLVTMDGLALGSFCIIDTKPRAPLNEHQREMLKQLASMAMLRIENLRNANYFDPVTGLFNRQRFEEDVEICRGAPQGAVAVAADMIAPAFLNDIVKALGYPFSAQLMVAITQRLQHVLGDTCQLYKISPTRFGFIFSGTQDMQALLPRLTRELERPIDCAGIPLQIRPGLGILEVSKEGWNDDWLRLLVSSADHARETGRGWLHYNAELDVAQQRAFTLLTSLTEAVHASDQLYLEYQPRIDVATGEMVSVEALLRWQHPKLGNIPPAEFIPLAEKTVLIRPLSLWVARQAIQQAARWQKQGHHWRISINISASDMEDGRFVDEVIVLLRDNRLAPERMELEFTESVLMTNPDETLGNLQRLRDLGMELAIDDFGTGYSNWTYLRELPATTVKLDQSFMRNVLTDTPDQTIVKSLIQLARQLGYRVVAEGVETEALYQLLSRWGCDEIQGYFIAHSMGPDQLVDWYNDRSPLPVTP